MSKKERIALRGLYAITPDLKSDQDLLGKTKQALSAGVYMLQYRDKLRDHAGKTAMAHQLKALCGQYNTVFIVNDDIGIACEVNADGVHLGAEDGDLQEARSRFGQNKIIGTSCYADLDRARQMVSEGADYVAFGAVCPSPTKPNAARAPLSLIMKAKASLDVPVCVIGGITLKAAPELINAGADLLAVITDIFEADDIASQVKAYNDLFAGV